MGEIQDDQEAVFIRDAALIRNDLVIGINRGKVTCSKRRFIGSQPDEPAIKVQEGMRVVLLSFHVYFREKPVDGKPGTNLRKTAKRSIIPLLLSQINFNRITLLISPGHT